MADKAGATVLDVCCGGKLFWFDRNDPRAVFLDIRKGAWRLTDRTVEVDPDAVADFRALPFGEASFPLVVFDPPHLTRAGKRSYFRAKYGVLGPDWRDDLARGFAECFRVLKPLGTLAFKWCDENIRVAEVLKLAPEKPLFGSRRGKTMWVIFQKGET
jgi:SAM-dependent methyltransferase